jgi:hypothetical protein
MPDALEKSCWTPDVSDEAGNSVSPSAAITPVIPTQTVTTTAHIDDSGLDYRFLGGPAPAIR